MTELMIQRWGTPVLRFDFTTSKNITVALCVYIMLECENKFDAE